MAAFLGGDTGDVLGATPSTRCWSRTWSGRAGRGRRTGWGGRCGTSRPVAGWARRVDARLPAGLRVDLESGDGLAAFTNSTAGAFGPQVAPLLTEFMEREPKSAEPGMRRVTRPSWSSSACGTGARP